MADGTTPLTAYLQLVPKIDTTGMKKDVTPALEAEGSRAGNSFGKSFLVAFAALGVGAAMVGSIKKSFNEFANFEQLSGGAALLWGDAFDYISERAANAFDTMGMSQNQYLEQANGFATAFKTYLNDDERAAAELADRIMQTQADVVAAMGISQESAAYAINGILRGNYTMLDNLKLGITPTQEGFAAMIATVNEFNASQGKMTNYQMGNYADMASALADYVEMQGLAGYAAMEGASTITGSVARTQAAWSNLLSGMAQENADVAALTGQFVDTVVDSASLIIPRVLQITQGLFEALPTAIEQLMPALMEFLVGLVESLPEIMESGMIAITRLIEGIAAELPTLMVCMVDALVQMADTLSKPENLVPLLHAALVLINELARGLVLAIPELLEALPTIIDSLVDSFVEFAPQFLQMGVQIIAGISTGIIKAGVQLVNSLLQVVKNAWNKAKSWLGIASPSKRFAEMGGFVAAGLAQGIEGGAGNVNNAIEGLVGDMTHRAEVGLNAFGIGSTVTVNASINASSLADVNTVSQLVNRLYDSRMSQQVRIERMGAAYGY